MSSPRVRRIRADEWELVRDLRREAVDDPDAAIAFLSTPAQEAAHEDDFWRERAVAAAQGDNAAQFVLVEGDLDEGEWVGTVTVLRRRPGSTDHLERLVRSGRADVVGVYVRPSHRGGGGIDVLLQAAARWTAAHGDAVLTLDVHRDNLRAQAAYTRAGFRTSGATFTGPIGPEIEMTRTL